MSSTLKLIRRFLIILLLSFFLLLIFNLILSAVIASPQRNNGGTWTAAESVASSLVKSTDNSYSLSADGTNVLKQYDAWGILIDSGSGKVKWHSQNTPQNIPMKYSASDIASAVRGYICDYPTASSGLGKDLLLLGFPKKAYWKQMWPTYDYNFIANLPKTALLFLLCNLVVILLIYMITSSGVFRSVKPILKGIEALPEGKEIHVKERGMLSGLAVSINKSAEKLRMQDWELRKKESARANWIAGVSHDIRTPLSMVMGYAGQLESDMQLNDSQRKKASVIRKQSERMKNLINDLNLTSKLEYNMQPVELIPFNIVAVSRQAAVDFINMDVHEKYPIHWLTTDALSSYLVVGDKSLLKRAIINIIQNSINHNEAGCNIYITVEGKKLQCKIRIDDDGKGASDEQIAKLNNTPHYMFCDESFSEQRHGLGLQIVKQIISVHHGQVSIEHSKYGGFSVSITLPAAL